MKIFFFFIITLNLLSTIIVAQIFSELTSVTFKQLEYSSCSWGDYDNDGDLDIILTGSSQSATYLYKNIGNGQFTEIILENVPSVTHGKVDFVDYDNDGYLDILITGRGSYRGNVATIYKNNKAGSFIYQFMINLEYGEFTSFDFEDTDGDGDIDIVNNGNLYVNYGDNIFKKKPDAGIEYTSRGSVDFGDYDSDGYLDLVITGDNGWPDYAFSKVYKNMGNNYFVQQNDIILDNVSSSDAQWGDFDGDGDLDIVLSGFTDNPESTLNVYCNNGNNSFEKTNISNKRSTNTKWGDYNNDGLLDFAVSHKNEGTLIYKNINNSSFELQIDENIEGVNRGDIRWGDYDNDGDLDILITGDNKTKLYTNNIEQANLPPTAPLQLIALADSTNVVLSWDKGSDESTPDLSLSYAVTLIRGIDEEIISSFSINNGYRKIARHGAIQCDTFRKVNQLEPGEYRWQVQSIDNSFIGSPFSQTGYFYMGEEIPIVAHSPKFPLIASDSTSMEILIKNIGKGNMSYEISQIGEWFSLSVDNGGDSTVVVISCDENTESYRKGKIILNFVNPDYSPYTIEVAQTGGEIFTEVFEISQAGESYGSFSWCDFDNDLDLDFLITGNRYSSQSMTDLYVNNGENGFLKDVNFSATKIRQGFTTCCDYNNDGNMDFLISGQQDYNGDDKITKMYRNSGEGTFIEETQIVLPGLTNANASFGDYNNNGNTDFAIIGIGDNTDFASVFVNISDTNFVQDTLNALTPLWAGDIDWLDINKDNKLDILQSGYKSGSWSAHLYINNGDETFTDNYLGSYRYSSWGDFNNDGNIDICLNGSIFLFDDSGEYILSEHANLPLSWRHTWGDYDNDGDLDVVLCGSSYIKLFENNGNAVFQPAVSCNFTESFGNDIQFVDYNNDGKLDIMITNNSTAKLYKNNYYHVNQKPDPPTILSDSVWSDYVFMVWNEGNDIESTAAGLYYNGYLYKDNGDTIWNSKSDKATGFLKTVHHGNANKNTHWMLHLEQPGTYFWSVQSIDQAYKGSTFADEKQFSISEFLAFDESMHNAHFQIQKNYSICWEEAFLEFVKLEYSLDDGITWNLIGDSITARVEKFDWLVPFISPGECMLRITDNQFGMSDNITVYLTPYIDIITPVDSLQFKPNNIINITWDSEFSEYVRLSYAKAYELIYSLIEDSIQSEVEYFNWEIPIIEPTDYVIRIIDVQYPDAKDSATIKILPYLKILQPSGQEELVQNTYYDIKWESSYLDTINIRYMEDGGFFSDQIATNVPVGQNLYTWEVPPFIMYFEDYKIIISDYLGKVSDTSMIFSIVSAIDELPTNSFLTVYPNPCNDILFIDLHKSTEDCNVELLDLLGNVRLRKIIKGGTIEKMKISDLRTGIYMLTLKVDNKIYQKKIIKTE